MFVYIVIGLIVTFVLIYLFLILPHFTMRQQIRPFLGRAYAHRGLHDAQNLIPENSMSAFKEAVKHKLAIELDIHLTRDRKIVVFHDELLMRMCQVSGTVEDSTYEELQKLRLLNTDERIPLFTEVLDYVDGRVPLLIELKLPSGDMSLCAHAVEILKNYRGPYMVQSFNSLGIRWFRQNEPSILRGQLSDALTKGKHDAPYVLRFCVQHLLTDLLCRPDFISYKLKDTANLSVFILHKLMKTPTAVWTLRSAEDCCKAKEEFDMYIFEHKENIKYLENA